MYRWDKDDEFYTESEAWEIACEEVDEIDMKEVFQQEFDFEWIWKHLNQDAKIELSTRAAELYLQDYFIYVDEDDEEDEDED